MPSRTPQHPLRRTKIVATVGPASAPEPMLDTLIGAGVNVFRLNFSHGTADTHRDTADKIRRCAEQRGQHVAILADLQGPKIRIGCFRDGPIMLSAGQPFTLDTALPDDAPNAEQVGVSYPPLPTDWLTVAGQLDKYDNSVAINMAFILGNSPVRIWSVGWNDRPATPAELEDMKSVVREAMEEGAWGLSTGLDYPPGSYASTAELAELAGVAARLGGHYHTHTRASLRSKGLLAPWEEALEIGRGGDCPVHLTHYRQSAAGVGSHLDYIGLVEDARDEGMDVTFDCYTYPYSGTTPTIGLPHWAKDGGPERLMAALRDADDRERMKREITRDRLENNWLTNFKQPQNMQYDGKLITDIADMRGQDPADTLFDLLIEENLGISTVGLGTNAQTLYAFVSHPAGMIASDAILFGEYPNPRTYGCFPIVLAEFVRAEKHLKLPEAIRKMTSFPAQRLGLPDRGLLRNGFKADIVIFNPDTVKTHATKEDPKHYPVGIHYVIVNGKVVIENGENTGVLPGRGLRRGRAST